MKKVIVTSFTTAIETEEFANRKAEEGYKTVSLAFDISPRTGMTHYVVCMELVKFERVGGSE